MFCRTHHNDSLIPMQKTRDTNRWPFCYANFLSVLIHTERECSEQWLHRARVHMGGDACGLRYEIWGQGLGARRLSFDD